MNTRMPLFLGAALLLSWGLFGGLMACGVLRYGANPQVAENGTEKGDKKPDATPSAVKPSLTRLKDTEELVREMQDRECLALRYAGGFPVMWLEWGEEVTPKSVQKLVPPRVEPFPIPIVWYPEQGKPAKKTPGFMLGQKVVLAPAGCRGRLLLVWTRNGITQEPREGELQFIWLPDGEPYGREQEDAVLSTRPADKPVVKLPRYQTVVRLLTDSAPELSQEVLVAEGVSLLEKGHLASFKVKAKLVGSRDELEKATWALSPSKPDAGK